MGESMNKIKNYFNDILLIIRKPVTSILPGQLSFFFLLSLIPIFLLIGIISTNLSSSTTIIEDILTKSTPGDISTLLLPLLSGGVDYNIIILIISALLLVSKGTRSIMRVSSSVYEIKDTTGIKAYIKSFILAIVLILLISFIIIIPVFGSKILNMFKVLNIFPNLSESILNSYDLLKWPISIFIVFINLKVIYLFSLNKKIPSKSVNKGALFTTIVWVILTLLYSYYIDNMSKYTIFYGGAAKIIVLMLWTYLISYVFVLGICINVNDLKKET